MIVISTYLLKQSAGVIGFAQKSFSSKWAGLGMSVEWVWNRKG